MLQREITELERQGFTLDVEERLGGLKPEDIAELGKPKDDEGEDEDAKPYALKDLPGLKMVIATLTACNPEPGSPLAEGEQAYSRDIYVHSKLLVVDDVFSLLSSANINTRSMHTDSELGLAAPDAELAKNWRDELWNLHLHVPLEAVTAKLVALARHALCLVRTKKGGYPKVAAPFMPAGKAYSASL
ncbi:phospholipase D-like domain-containing protein [Pseudomonas protegens]|uniref:phospholipase D-like domain-containing protein n=1 Tax=Pseudomonas protegens TaxID=380021 RepID=UPI000CD237B5|nr:phospholipase D-like domain-containing protein [Pseudomonas protegens]POA81151.1 hypothetical protein C1883_30925 [Pseudomonas protegens]